MLCNSRIFLAGLAYLQYNQITNINWNKLQQFQIIQIQGISLGSSSADGLAAATASSLAMTNFGIALTDSV